MARADSATTPAPTELERLVALGVKAARAYDRPDLADRLATRLQGAAAESAVLIAGEFKQGKSALVNAMLNAEVCPVDDVRSTAVVSFVRHAAQPSVRVADQDPSDLQPVPLGRVRALALGEAPTGTTLHIAIPRRLLAEGLVLVDTPGIARLGAGLEGVATALLPLLAGVLFVTDASQELTEPELAFLSRAVTNCPAVACVVTKIDLYPDWRRIADLDRGHLDRCGIAVPVIPTSAMLRTRALVDGDEELNGGSGYPGLVRWLRAQVLVPALSASDGAARRELAWVVGQLESRFLAERRTLGQGGARAEVHSSLRHARAEAERLRGETARWQVLLSDGAADLSSDVEHFVRERLRALVREAEGAIDDGDPARDWDGFTAWLADRAGQAVAEGERLLAGRAQALATAVDEEFAAAASTVVDHVTGASRGPDVDVHGGLKAGSRGAASAGLTALRGTYGGVLMISMAGRMLGLAAVMPVALVAGALLGHHALREERQRQLAARRQQAKAAVRSYIDEITFQSTAELRTGVRLVHRHLRDAFAARAEELLRAANDAGAAAEQAVRASGDEARRRASDVDAELVRLAELRRRIAHHAASTTPPS